MSLLYELSLSDWVLLSICGFLIGASKTGLVGIGMVTIPLFAHVFGGKPSTGVILPMLIFADLFAIRFYRGHVQWKYIVKLSPYVIFGVLTAVFTGNHINDFWFRLIMALTILVGLFLMVGKEIKGENLHFPENRLTAGLTGTVGGFGSMMGNAAGPIMSIYFLLMRLPKNAFIGTRAWFFFLINVFKLPLHGFVWETINPKSLTFDVIMIPAIAIGAISGKFLIAWFPENAYRFFVIFATFISVIVMMV